MKSRNKVDFEPTGKAKKFVRYEEGAELYSVGLCKFKEIAKDANAVYKIGRVVLVNIEKIDAYLETFANHS